MQREGHEHHSPLCLYFGVTLLSYAGSDTPSSGFVVFQVELSSLSDSFNVQFKLSSMFYEFIKCD